jgi:hypothetical protein
MNLVAKKNKIQKKKKKQNKLVNGFGSRGSSLIPPHYLLNIPASAN